jgi:hypothetical protein
VGGLVEKVAGSDPPFQIVHGEAVRGDARGRSPAGRVGDGDRWKPRCSARRWSSCYRFSRLTEAVGAAC